MSNNHCNIQKISKRCGIKEKEYVAAYFTSFKNGISTTKIFKKAVLEIME